MTLKTYKLGELIKQRREKYSGIEDLPIKGVTRDGFIPPKQKDADTSLYNVFYLNDFVFNPARMEVNSISLNTDLKKGICSSLYEVFYVKDETLLLPKYLNLFVKRREFARECEFIGWGSAREYCRVADISNITITLPDITVQQKYIDIYESMVANQKSYEQGLDDLKLTCDALLDKLKKECSKQEIGNLFTEVDRRNTDGKITSVKGINVEKKFIDTVADTNGVDLKKYKVVCKNELAYSGMQTGRDQCVRIALHDANKPILISPAYSVFQVDESKVLPEYIMIWFSRTEIDRLGWFYSDASIRANLDNDRLFEMQIPIPDIKVQRAIADIYKVYTERKRINEQLKQQIKDICPILIKGSLEE